MIISYIDTLLDTSSARTRNRMNYIYTTSLCGCRLSSHMWTKERNRQLGTTAYFGSIKRDSSGSRYLVEKHDAAYAICALYVCERVKIDT